MTSRVRKGIIVGLAVISLLGAVFYLHFFLLRSTGSGPAGPQVALEPFASAWTSRPVLLLGMGDSVTAGYGASEGKSYFARLVNNPPDEFDDMVGRNLTAVFPNLTVRNVSVSGSTSLDHIRDQIPAFETQRPETLGVIVLTTGGNDLIHMYGRTPPREGAMYGASLEEADAWIANFETRLDEMITDVASKFPGGCHIFLANIYDPSDGVGTFAPVGLPPWPDGLAIHAQYNAVIARCAERYEYVHLIDIYAEFLGHGLFCRHFWWKHYDALDPHYWYFSNLEDPNDRGYDAIRRLMLNAMSKVFHPPAESIS